jgi:hypothetical protein
MAVAIFEKVPKVYSEVTSFYKYLVEMRILVHYEYDE